CLPNERILNAHLTVKRSGQEYRQRVKCPWMRRPTCAATEHLQTGRQVEAHNTILVHAYPVPPERLRCDSREDCVHEGSCSLRAILAHCLILIEGHLDVQRI